MALVERNIARQALSAGLPIPERIANAPKLRLGLLMYLEAYFDLDSERSHGMGLARIPWTSIADYAHAFSFDSVQTENLLFNIRRMDAANLERLESKHRDSKRSSNEA